MSGCRFISGDPRDAAFMGERVFCGAPVARQGGGLVRRASGARLSAGHRFDGAQDTDRAAPRRRLRARARTHALVESQSAVTGRSVRRSPFLDFGGEPQRYVRSQGTPEVADSRLK